MTLNSQLQAERDFTFHYYQEERNTPTRAAYEWVNDHGISKRSMIAFGYWEQRNNPQWLKQILEDEPPPFQIPWCHGTNLRASSTPLGSLPGGERSMTSTKPLSTALGVHMLGQKRKGDITNKSDFP